MQFSGIFGIEATEWTISTVNLQKNDQNMFIFLKKLSLFNEVAIFSIISFKIGFIGIVKYCFSFLWGFWCSSNCLGHGGCESVKNFVSMRLFEKEVVIM